jgi:tetratricopeptide (TPR) repeat protein
MNIAPAPLLATEAAQTLARVRSARNAGNLSECLRLAAACVHQAEVERDAETGYHALAAAGRLHYGRSEPEQAIVWFKEANAWASGWRLAHWLAPSFHDLFLAYLEAQRRIEAWRAFGRALDLYNPRDPRMACLTADASLDEMAKGEGKWTHDAFYSSGSCATAEQRVFTQVNLAESASLFSRRLFDNYWPALCDTLWSTDNGECVTRLLISAAESGLRMEKKDEAWKLADRAKRFAVEREEPVNEERADRLLG